MTTITASISSITKRKLSKIAKEKNVSQSALFLEAINDFIDENNVSADVVKQLSSSKRRMKRGSVITHQDFWKTLNV
ncbi:MAG: hypothetical protein WDA22_00460 [Bacteroidota bacterium]